MGGLDLRGVGVEPPTPRRPPHTALCQGGRHVMRITKTITSHSTVDIQNPNSKLGNGQSLGFPAGPNTCPVPCWLCCELSLASGGIQSIFSPVFFDSFDFGSSFCAYFFLFAFHFTAPFLLCLLHTIALPPPSPPLWMCLGFGGPPITFQHPPPPPRQLPVAFISAAEAGWPEVPHRRHRNPRATNPKHCVCTVGGWHGRSNLLLNNW